MLETLLCESFANDPVEECIDDFFECVKNKNLPIENPHKARAHAYLTTKPDPHSSVGVGAKKSYWDLDHSAFGNIRNFLQKIHE